MVKRGRWQAFFCLANGTKSVLGTFRTAVEAAEAHDMAALSNQDRLRPHTVINDFMLANRLHPHTVINDFMLASRDRLRSQQSVTSILASSLSACFGESGGHKCSAECIRIDAETGKSSLGYSFGMLTSNENQMLMGRYV